MQRIELATLALAARAGIRTTRARIESAGSLDVLVTNDDDHPRHHALVRTPRGWRLSPAYDLVPSPKVSIERRDLALTVGRYGRAASVYNLVSHSKRFGLDEREARSVIEEVIAVVRQWREVYASCGVSPADRDAIAPAFLPEGFFYEAPPAG